MRSAFGQIGLVDHDDVGDLELTGLFPLQVVAGLRLHEHDHDIRDVANRRVSLSGPHGLHHDRVESETAEETNHAIKVRRNARMTAGRGQAADEQTQGRRPGSACGCDLLAMPRR